MGLGGKLYTLAEVSKHNTKQDCWLAIRGKVYDITKFMDDHPGGDEVLLQSTGKDASLDFEEVGHSNSAIATMDEYYVGDLDWSTIPSTKADATPQQPKYEQDSSPDFIVKLLQFIVPVLIMAVAVYLRYYKQ